MPTPVKARDALPGDALTVHGHHVGQIDRWAATQEGGECLLLSFFRSDGSRMRWTIPADRFDVSRSSIPLGRPLRERLKLSGLTFNANFATIERS